MCWKYKKMCTNSIFLLIYLKNYVGCFRRSPPLLLNKFKADSRFNHTKKNSKKKQNTQMYSLCIKCVQNRRSKSPLYIIHLHTPASRWQPEFSANASIINEYRIVWTSTVCCLVQKKMSICSYIYKVLYVKRPAIMVEHSVMAGEMCNIMASWNEGGPENARWLYKYIYIYIIYTHTACQ